jgi:hypothetical protein
LPDSHPYPPSDFNEQNLPVSYREGLFYRLNPASYASAIYYDASGMGRFDLKNKLGVLYLGESIEAAFIESFGRVLGQKYVSREFVKSRNLFALKSDRPLQLLNLAPGASQSTTIPNRLMEFFTFRAMIILVYAVVYSIAGIIS